MKTGLHPTHGQRLGLKPMLEPVDDTLAPRDLSGIVSATPIPTFNSGVVLSPEIRQISGACQEALTRSDHHWDVSL